MPEIYNLANNPAVGNTSALKVDVNMPSQGEYFLMDIGEGGKRLYQRQGNEVVGLGFQYPTDWQGKTIGSLQNQYTNEALSKLGIEKPMEVNTADYSSWLKNAGITERTVKDMNQFLGSAVTPTSQYSQNVQSVGGVNTGGTTLANTPMTNEQAISSGLAPALTDAQKSALSSQGTVQAAGSQTGQLGLTGVSGIKILNETDLQAKRDELAKAGVPQSEWSKYISSPDATGALYWKQPATLYGPNGQKEVVPTGSARANQLFSQGWSLTPQGNKDFIDSNLLGESPEINIGKGTQSSGTSYADTTIAGGAKYSEQVKAEIERNKRPEDEQDLQIKNLLADLTSIYKNQKSLETIKAEEYAKIQKTELEQKISEIADEIDILLAKSNALDTSYKTANLEEEGRPQTLSRLQGAQARNYKMYLAQHDSIASDIALKMAEGKKLEGKLNDAVELANNAINLRYQSQQDTIKNRIDMFNILIPQIDKKDKEYAEAVKAIEDRKSAVIDEKMSWMKTAVSAGIFDANVLKQVENAGSFAEAMGIIGKNMPQSEEVNLLAGLTKEQISQYNTIQTNIRQDADIKGFVEIRDAYNRILATGKNVSPAGDLALIFNYMKMLDPGSTVREGEFANAQNSGSIPQQLMAKYNKILNGERLTTEQRTDFLNQSENLYNAKLNNYNDTIDFYGNQLDQFGIPRDLALRDYEGSNIGINNLQPLMQSYNSLSTLIQENPDYYSIVEQMIKREPNLSDEDILQILTDQSGFSRVGGDTKTAVNILAKPEGSAGGQCGRFVNQITGLGLGDSYQSKIAKMDKSIKYPQPGMVFVMPLSGSYSKYGHTGIILDVNNGIATVKDSNWGKDEKIRIHTIPVSKMTGFARTNINNLA